jgi:phosphoenolpyruvate carboxykinase (GTP)
MSQNYETMLRDKMDDASWGKLTALENPRLMQFIGEYVSLCQPDTVHMCDDSDEDSAFIRRMAVEKGEETPLAKENQTVHYDGYGDQARDKVNTRFLVPREKLELMKHLNSVEYEEGIGEIRRIANGVMKGKMAIVKLFCEGPTQSPFSRACAQITDSFYVAHSEDMLYRRGYEHFQKMADKDDFYRFVHSAGELDNRGCTVNLADRRIYMDCENLIVYSMNAQYAGNSVGLKKHSMRLAIRESGEQGWLCEHMFVMTLPNEEKGRNTYFCGAFPSACGKTSTAMLPGEKVVGDDIAYFRNMNGEFRAVNVENGIFGIIKDVNAKDDPVIFDTLMDTNEVIFSNVLTGPDNEPYWLGMGSKTPTTGSNHSGPGWFEGKKDAADKPIQLAHSNARYTLRLEYLDNIDPVYNDKLGVKVGGVIYGGRDSDTCAPVEESFNWEEGIILKACTLESETTSATLGQEGVRKHQPMANLDFISYPMGQYVQNNLKFVEGMKEVPKVYAVNYFLRDKEGKFCSSMLAKKVWLHWMEQRVHGEVEAYKTPTGFIPLYEDLKPLFRNLLGEEFTEEQYTYQFSFRCDPWIAKLDRAAEWFGSNFPDTPELLFKSWKETQGLVRRAKEQYGSIIKPGDYKG